jgi:hypothetical protein
MKFLPIKLSSDVINISLNEIRFWIFLLNDSSYNSNADVILNIIINDNNDDDEIDRFPINYVFNNIKISYMII